MLTEIEMIVGVDQGSPNGDKSCEVQGYLDKDSNLVITSVKHGIEEV